MSRSNKVIGIVGSYRKDGIVDQAVTEILDAASLEGASAKKVYLVDKHIEFCTNCRECMQVEGSNRGKCVLEDDMEAILQEIESAQGIVIGSPVNFGNVTALMRMFMERSVGYVYWPWEIAEPEIRDSRIRKKAVLVSASGAPAWKRPTFRQASGALKYLTGLLGAHPIGFLWVHKVNKEDMRLPEKAVRKARKLGHKLGRGLQVGRI